MSEEIEAFGCAMSLSKRVFNRDKNGKVAPNFPKSAKTVLSHPGHYGKTTLILILRFCFLVHRPCRSIEKGSSHFPIRQKGRTYKEKTSPRLSLKEKGAMENVELF